MKIFKSLLIVVLNFCIISCNNSSSTKSVQNLPGTIDQINPSAIDTQSITYAIASLNITIPEYAPTGKPIQHILAVSEVTEIANFNDDAKYKLMDKYQTNFLDQVEAKVYKYRVTKRECYAFSSYSEASKYREIILGQRKEQTNTRSTESVSSTIVKLNYSYLRYIPSSGSAKLLNGVARIFIDSEKKIVRVIGNFEGLPNAIDIEYPFTNIVKSSKVITFSGETDDDPYMQLDNDGRMFTIGDPSTKSFSFYLSSLDKDPYEKGY